MFKKGPDIDKKKLLAKASDVKKDSLTRLKHFKTLIEHQDFSEVHSLFRSHFSFIYHTFIDTFSTFDSNSRQKRDDLECILFIFEKIIIYNPELIKKRWQFYSITFVMQRLLHNRNTWQLRQEGVRLFILWYQILCDDKNAELQQIFGTLVPGLVPESSLPTPASPNSPSQQHPVQQQFSQNQQNLGQNPLNLPIKLCSIEPLMPMSPNEQMPNDEISFYLDNLLQYMVTQTTKPFWTSLDEARKNQELGFSFMFSMFKKIYLQSLFPSIHDCLDVFNLSHVSPSSAAYIKSNAINQYVDDSPETVHRAQIELSSQTGRCEPIRPQQLFTHKKIQHRQQGPTTASNKHLDQDNIASLSIYQAVVIKWLTRILRQDMIPGQDELIKAGASNSVDLRENRVSASRSMNDSENIYMTEGNSTTIFQGIENTSAELEVARRVIGTWPDNITVVHELFRRSFLSFHQPASMKRVVNVYKEWICNGIPNQANNVQGRNLKVGYTSFNDLLQIFVLNSSNAFLTQVQNSSILDEQYEMCKRIMNIYRYMVMKIYMNTPTWEQLLDVMLMITERLFPCIPPERKESTIGGRIAPAFFQTFIVSWIRANLYVHISPQMWYKFHNVMRNLVCWRELIEEWGTTMGSLTRVLVKHVYGLSLTDLPLDRPQERRRRPKALKSFSTADTANQQHSGTPPESPSANTTLPGAKRSQGLRPPRSGSVRLPNSSHSRGLSKSLARSNSDGAMFHNLKIYYSASIPTNSPLTPKKVRKIKSEYLIFTNDLSGPVGLRSGSPSAHNDAIDGTSLKESMIIEHDQPLDSHHSGKSSIDSNAASQSKPQSKRPESRASSDKCVLMGGTVRGWTPENSIIMWRRMLGLFGNINQLEDPENHLIAMKCLASVLSDFIKTRDNLGISIDNQSTPDHPSLIPPYTYAFAWILEATHLPKQFRESRLLAYKLLCTMSIRRHDTELAHQYFTAFYETLQRALTSPDHTLHSTIIANCTQLLSLELPGSTFLVQGLYERSRSILFNSPASRSPQVPESSSQDQAVQILNTILALYKPIKKLMVIKSELNNSMNLVAPGDMKTKVFEALMTCNSRSLVLDSQTRCKSLCALANHVYQELFDKNDSIEIEKLFDVLLTELQDCNNNTVFRMNCDILRLFADHAVSLTNIRPALVSSLIQIICQLIVRLSTNDANKESIHFLIICLEDWCMAVSKSFLLRPIGQLNVSYDDEDNLNSELDDTLMSIVLRSLESVIHDEQFADDAPIKGPRSSANTSKNSDTNSSTSRLSQGLASNSGTSQRDRTTTNSEQHLQPSGRPKQQTPHSSDSLSLNSLSAIKIACKVSHLKLVTYLGHFPLRQVGPASLSCCVNELDYLLLNGGEHMTESECENSGGMFLVVVDGATVVSFIGAGQNNDGSHQPFHMIVRNLCGKYSWDISSIESDIYKRVCSINEKDSIIFDPDTFQEVSTRNSMKYDSDFNDDGTSNSSLSSRASSNRDCLGDLLNHLSNCLAMANGSTGQITQRLRKNSALSVSNPHFKIAQAEETMIALLTNQRFQELNHCEKSDDNDRLVIRLGNTYQKSGNDSGNSSGNRVSSTLLTLEQCRQFVQQLGFLSWEKRCKIDSLAKSPRLLRELKNLDNQPSRETHKIAVIYVAAGQEDKNSILMNSTGSKAFEEFVSGLGWEVNLASHLGFKGGLQSNKSTGETSAYYCNATTEVMFHVSTLIPINKPPDDESLNRKLRHLGNDEIHIVWSEHSRDYRRGIIPTEFGDVIIAVYPMLTFQNYYRIQISSKKEVQQFGPLFDNCIVHQTCLAQLVRATAINASRAKRLKLPYYQTHFEERCRLIDTIVQNHREKLSFEEFAVQLYGTSELKPNTNATTATMNTTSTTIR